ncbi:hypothetical protein PTKIN_Ptkin14bG0190900 [Pterospermum kingtungense]
MTNGSLDKIIFSTGSSSLSWQKRCEIAVGVAQAARGTFGYMATELFYKNIEDISHKADVYSFGMMLMEIVGKRKNLNASAEHSSQIYFPSWIYNQLDKGKNEAHGSSFDEQVLKMLESEMKPEDRPSMSNVMQMLENEVELSICLPSLFSMSLEMSMRD